MGWKLARNVLDNAPGDLSPAERLVLEVIAFSVRDDTGQGWIDDTKLHRRTGMSSQGVACALRRLSKRGFELRVPTGIDKKGRTTYAHRGRARTYRIPEHWRTDFESPLHDETFAEQRSREGETNSDGWSRSDETFLRERSRESNEWSRESNTMVSPSRDPGVKGVKKASQVDARVREAVELIAERLSVGLDDGMKIYTDWTTKATSPIRNPVAYANRCLDDEARGFMAGLSTMARDPSCPDCWGSGQATNANDQATPCPRCRPAKPAPNGPVNRADEAKRLGIPEALVP
jgi:hypothetical protein